jgi:hypothetical protein
MPYLDRISTLEGVAELSGHIPGICTDPTEYKAIALRLLGKKEDALAVELALRLRSEVRKTSSL